MNELDFFSKGEYIALPTKSKPKVMLNVSNPEISILSYQLYNPFSHKTKLLKSFTRYLNTQSVYFKKWFPHVYRDQSPFLLYLENELKIELHSSIYYSTVGDKVVVQLVSRNEIFGYLKMPISEIGKGRILNEFNAITILSKIKLVEPAKYFSSYQGCPYLILYPIHGKIGDVCEEKVFKVLNDLQQEKYYFLNEHPRIQQLRDNIVKLNSVFLLEKLNSFCANSSFNYKVVYEHGDFAPWNLIQTSNIVRPFDFEYFEEFGLEYLDLLKYYYQIGKLIKALNYPELLRYMAKKFQFEEFNQIFGIFLIKEIIRCKTDLEPHNFELNMLNVLNEK